MSERGVMDPCINFDNSFARLPGRFFAEVSPTPVRAPALVAINHPLAVELGIDPTWLASADGVAVLAGNVLAEGSTPIATAYAGHQFGHYSPQLGDGRAVLLGEVIDRTSRRRDIQLKGAGRTPWSRGGDGRAGLGPVLREYVVSEAMAALGIPTTRALAAVTTGEAVVRETLLPGAILTRVASSHIRVGTFQFHAAQGDVDGVRMLADHVIARHYPEATSYRAMLEAMIEAQARLVARWLCVGFIHGVMNTDNSSIAGETIDYGPCAFMDGYDPATVFSSIDHQGRYAYGNQPRMAQWNMTRLAEALLPILGDDDDTALAEARAALATFAPTMEGAYHDGLRAKVGLFTVEPDDIAMVNALLNSMTVNQVDFTLMFRGLGDIAGGAPDETVRGLFVDPTACDAWLMQWRERAARETQTDAERRVAMHAVNPAFIPRNHRIEAMIVAAAAGDYTLFADLMTVLSRPYDDQPAYARYAAPPAESERVVATFCGT